MKPWGELLHYRDGKLFWLVSINPKAPAGSEAGTLRGDGYKVFGYQGRKWLAHRVIWELHFGGIPEGYVIDHIDNNPRNNRVENLRCVSYSGNNLNKKYLVGVGLHKKSGKWRAYTKESGRSKHLGSFTNFCAAVQCRKQREKILKEKEYGNT